MASMTFVDAVRLGLAEEMRADPTVWALGEDIGRGGVFQQYKGLQGEFGPERIVDTPISESAIMGAAVGAAMVGTRPVVEMRYIDFALCAVDELVNQAAKARFMFGGQARVPLVVRQPVGIWATCAAQHSQSLEAWWVHVPGLVVLAPSTPEDGRKLLKAAIRCDDPVVHLEHKELWQKSGEVDENDQNLIEIGKARIATKGKDVTIVAWSQMAHTAIAAAELLARDNISAEVIDLRSLWPWDREAVLASASKTRHVLVAQEAVRAAGFGAEIAATVTEELGVKVARIGAPRVPVPFSPPLEDVYRIGPDRLAAAAKTLLG